MSFSIINTVNIRKKNIKNNKNNKNNKNDINDEKKAVNFIKKLSQVSAKASTNCYIYDIPQYYSGISLLSSYNVPVIAPSNGIRKVKVAIVIAYSYPNLINDFQTYWKSPAMYGQNSTPPTINVYKTPGATYDAGWASEECLDVQMIASINPKAEIWVVEAKSSSLSDLSNAVNYATNTIKADIVSMSWGSDDNSYFSSNYTTLFNTPNTCFCASSGDANVVSWPSTSISCLSIGGTTMNIFNSYRKESTWTSAGCGYSISSSKPSFQSSFNSSKRIIPDVSAIANPLTGVYTFCNSVWEGIGGTSVSCPIWAGILSLAVQNRLNHGKSPLSTSNMSLQNYLYKNILTNQTKYNNCFNDVVCGSDTGTSILNTLTSFQTGTGFDIPTGLGTPNVTNLCNELLLL
jgi:subtilase family serine protease